MDMDIRLMQDKNEIKKCVDILLEGSDKGGKRVIAEWSMFHFRGVPVWIGFIDDQPVTLNISHFGKQKRDVWTPYMNFYTTFTRMDVRRRGYASHLYTYLRDKAIAVNCLRVKSLAGTTLGLRFHQAFKDQIWAWTDRNSMMIDSPLVDPSRFPVNTTPIAARKWTRSPQPMTNDEIEHSLQTMGFWYER
jgi:hypothetical protein